MPEEPMRLKRCQGHTAGFARVSAAIGALGLLCVCSDRHAFDTLCPRPQNPGSGRLALRRYDGSPSTIDEGFLMENTESEGDGPESMLHFIKACRGQSFYEFR